MHKMLKIVGSCALILLYFQSACFCDNAEERMNLMQGDIMGIAPSLLQSDMGSTNEAHWPNNRVPYVFEDNYPEEFKDQFRRAAEHIAERTCIKFIPRTNQNDYVRVIQDVGCYSYIGRIKGPQKMSLPHDCQTFGTVVHEMLHAVGFRHEQARFNRDRYVKIIWDNIDPKNERQFKKDPMPISTRYDYNSVMHYIRHAFSINKKATIVPKWKEAFIGQRIGMSRGDVYEVRKKFCNKR